MSDWDYPFQNSYILNEAQWEEWEPNMHGVPDGVKRGVYGEFEVTPASSGLVVNVAGGVAVVRGFYCRRGSAKPLTLQPPDTQNPRIDLVVLRRSISGGGFARMVITGDPAANPTAPNPAQDNDNWDLPLAEIYVAANAQSLDASDITDRRVWTSGLGEHMDDTDNPHQVTPAQIGAATAVDLQAHKDDNSNPHQVTYDQVGAASASHTLGSHSDVDVAGAADGAILMLIGGVWGAGVSNEVPTGAILPFGGTSAPSGYLMCNGAAVPRTAYADLFNVIGTAFGAGDGRTTFNVPDLRGLFLRGRDGGAGRDIDRARRTSLLPGGNAGDNVGSYQQDEIKAHTHTVWQPYGNGAANGSGAQDVDRTMQSGSTGGSETRPKNVYVNFIIKT